GKPNAGKSTLINWALGEQILMVSHKANATRKRFLGIAMFEEAQIVFVDTPGLHQSDKKLNKYMQTEATKAQADADVIILTLDSRKAIAELNEFNSANDGIKYIIVLTKIDMISRERLLETIAKIDAIGGFLAIVPTSSTKNVGLKELFKTIVEFLPEHPYYFDPDDLTPQTTRDIYRELIRESLFDNLSDELPYESDVRIIKVEENDKLDRIFAEIIVAKDSQKQMAIGANGTAIKRIGKAARLKIEKFSGKKIFLDLTVKVIKNWTTDEASLRAMGYEG
ncbi:MAG: GTP-binding protein, partial [Pseudomonadota bacterium]